MRRTEIEAELVRIENEFKVKVRPDPALLDEVVNLVEYPKAVCGGFDESDLAIPAEIIVSAMRGHQRYFATEREPGKLPHADNAIDIVYAPGAREGEPATLEFTPDFGDVTLENRTRTVAAGAEETIDFFREPGTMRIWAEGTVQLGSRTRTDPCTCARSPRARGTGA